MTLKLFQYQKLMEILSTTTDEDVMVDEFLQIFNKTKSDISQKEILDLISSVKNFKKVNIGKYIRVKNKIFIIQTDLLYDTASNYAAFENILLTNKDNPTPALHYIIAIYLRPLFGKYNMDKIAKYIQKNMDNNTAQSLYFFLSKKERKLFYNMRTYLLKQSLMTT